MTTPAPEPHGTGGAWARLDPRTIAATTIVVAGALAAAAVPVAIGLLLGGLGIWWVLLWTVGGTLVGTGATAVIEMIRLAVTRFRVDPHRIERRTRFLSSTTTSLSTGRVRNVEIAADLVQRRLGIAEVKLASGETDGSRLTLTALDREHAEQLRGQLLADRATADTSEVARLDPSWVRYAPASFMTPVFGMIAVGVVFQVAGWFNAVPAMLDWFRDLLGEVSWPLVAVGMLVLALVVGTVVSVVVFFESWWNLRLDHHEDGSLELRRGLLVGRHTSFDGRRVRGVTLHEPPGFRVLGAARLDVIAVGVSTGSGEQGSQKQSPALVPPSPRDVSAGVAETITRQPVPDDLRPHPPAARRRRLVRALLAVIGLAAVGVVPAAIWPDLRWVPLAVLVVAGVLAYWIAIDNARGLGHRVGDSLVAIRKGSLLRRTDLLVSDGLLGWNLRQTPFQRRAGLVTMVATSAGGGGAFRLPDVAEPEANRVWVTAGSVWDHLSEPAEPHDGA